MKFILSAILASLTLMSISGQVITQLGKENMNIPRGIKPEKKTPVTSVPVAVDTTGVYFTLVDSAQACINAQQWDLAQKYLRQAISTEPDNPNNSLLLSNIATMQRFQGQYAEAIRNYTMALDMTPQAVTLLLNRAALYTTIDSLSLAEADFKRVCDLDPTNTEARYSLGMLAVKKQDFKQAENYFNQIKRINPNSGLYNEGMGMVHKANGNYNKAAQCLSEVIKAHPDPALLANRADCYLMCKQLNNAEEDIRNALAMTPDDPYLYVLRAKLNKLRFNREDLERDIKLAVAHGLDRKTVEDLLK